MLYYMVKLRLEGIRSDELLSTFINKKDSKKTSKVKLDDVSAPLKENAKQITFFVDSRKNKIKAWRSQHDIHRGALPPFTKKPCWWCRHTFTTSPIGCPLRYYPNQVGDKKMVMDDKLKKQNVSSAANDFFETEGVFCSFPCAQAYILEQRSPRYNNSSMLLAFLYSKFFGSQQVIVPAPTWKVLETYGGHLMIEDFRKTFGKLSYEETTCVKRPIMYCSSRYIQEKKIHGDDCKAR